MDQPESKGIRMLSFDGGDRRAISQLIILDDIMRRIEWDTKSTNRILPCDYFDMIAGVGTGGIIAVLLAVLRLSIEDAVDEFLDIWKAVFVDSTLDRVARSEKLKAVMTDLLERRGIPANRKLAVPEAKDIDCKAFVCAVPESNLGLCEKFRNYPSRTFSLSPTIIEAVRATCAAHSLFTSVSINSVGAQISYTTGAYTFNNPTCEMIKEACEHFGGDRSVACVLSLGCGHRMLRVTDSIEEIASYSEVVENDLSWRIGKSNTYYRFQVDFSAAKSVEDIVPYTRNLLGQQTTIERIDRCAAAAERPGSKTLRDISGLVEAHSASAHGLPSLSAFFVERPDLIKRMADCVFRIGPSAQRRMVLSGLGGIGKTQITVSFLMQFLSRFRHVFFVDASSVQTMESDLIRKVKSLGVQYSRTTAIEALDVLANPDEEITRDWAIVYDNADSKDIAIKIAHYLPRCSFGTIILTTRNPNLGNLAPLAHIKLDIMSEDQASDVLLRSAIITPHPPKDSDRRHARDIARALGCLPVALVQAGYFIKQHDCMEDYLSRLLELRPDILQRPAEGQLDDHLHGVYDTFEVAWPHLSSRAQLFLNTLGFVNYTGFPLELIYRAAKRDFRFEPHILVARPAHFEQSIQLLRQTFQPGGIFSKQDVDDLVAEIEKYSLVTRVTTFKLKCLRFHPLVHSWIQDRLRPQGRETHQAAAVRLLVCGTGEDDEDISEFMYPHVTLLTDLGSLHINDRAGIAAIHAYYDLEAAIKVWEGILMDITSIPGDHTLRAGDVKLNLAALYRRRDDGSLFRHLSLVITPETSLIQISKSLEIEQEVVEYRKRILGIDDPETMRAITLQALGMAKSPHSQELIDAPKLLQAALSFWEKQGGENRELICQLKEALAYPRTRGFPMSVDMTMRSIKLGEEIIDMRMSHNGPEHWKTLAAKEELAYLLGEAADEGAATKDEKLESALWSSVVAKRTEARGPRHPTTLSAIGSLVDSYQRQGLFSDAEAQLKGMIALSKEVQDPYQEHLNHENLMAQLARTYYDSGRYEEAEAQWKEVIASTKGVEMQTNESALLSMAHLASMYHVQERYDESEVQLKELIAVTKDPQHQFHKLSLNAMKDLCLLYHERERYDEAEAQWKELIALTKDPQHQFHKLSLNAMEDLGLLYHERERYEEAEVQWKELIALTKDPQHQFHYLSLNAMNDLGRLYSTHKRYDEAEAQWEHLIAVTKNTFHQLHNSSRVAMYELGSMYLQQERYDKAEMQWKELITLTKDKHTYILEPTLLAMDDLAAMYHSRERYDDEEVQRKDLIAVTKDPQHTFHEFSVSAMTNLGILYDACERYAEAEAQWKEVLVLTKGTQMRTDDSTLDSMGNLATMYHVQERYDESEALWKELIAMRSEADGPAHPSVRHDMLELARLYEKRGWYQRAEDILVEAVDEMGSTDWPNDEIAELLKSIRSKLCSPPDAPARDPHDRDATPNTPGSTNVTALNDPKQTAKNKRARKRLRSPDKDRGEGSTSVASKRPKRSRKA